MSTQQSTLKTNKGLLIINADNSKYTLMYNNEIKWIMNNDHEQQSWMFGNYQNNLPMYHKYNIYIISYS